MPHFRVHYIGEPDIKDASLIHLCIMITDNVGIAAVSLKLPTFWPECTAVWFVQAEVQLHTRGISQDETKFHYITTALDQDTATHMLDLLQQPPAANKYETL